MGNLHSFLLDVPGNVMYVARDPIGINSLYIGLNSQQPGTFYLASELKCLKDDCDDIKVFPPGNFLSTRDNQYERFYKPDWMMKPEYVPTRPGNVEELRRLLILAVRKRLMSDVPFGVLLSGGLDSSIIAGIAAMEMKRLTGLSRLVEDELDESGPKSWPLLHTFAIGLVGSPDLLAARVVANHLKSIHHEFTYTIEEGLDALSDVIYHLETYDVTTIRASIPMFLLSRRIRAIGVKMVLSGEGSDEIFGGAVSTKEYWYTNTQTKH